MELFEKDVDHKEFFKNFVDCPNCLSDEQTYDARQKEANRISSWLITELESQWNAVPGSTRQEDKSGKKTANGKKVGATTDDKAQTNHDDCEAIIPVKDLVPFQTGESIFESLLITKKNGEVIYQDEHSFPHQLKLIVKSSDLLFGIGKAEKDKIQQENLSDASYSIPSDFIIHTGGGGSPGFLSTPGLRFFALPQ